MKYTIDIKLPLDNNNYNNCDEKKTKESIPMYTISSFSSDTTLQSRSSISKSSSLKGLGTIKLLILVTVLPIMILTIINPMWICMFMKYPHVHRTEGANQVSHERPQTHTYNKGGIKITKETFDIIVASKDGRRVEELETTITVIENIPPKNKGQIVKHEANNKKETNNVKAHTQISKTSKNNDESVLDNIREKIFKNRNSCAYLALSVILLCAVSICGIVCLSNDNQKSYESLDSDNDHYIRIEECDDDDDDDKTNVEDLEDEKSNDIENKTNKTDVCNTECTQIQIVSFNDSHFDDNINTLSPPPYSSNTDNELISNSCTSPENIQQSTDEN